MATTPAPLVWDFYRAVDDADNLGGVIHYYDEMAQSIYLSSGIKTDATVIPEGHWETSGYIKGIQVTQDSKMSLLRFDHPSNGILYGVAVDNNKLTFLRYIYAMDISQITDSWSWLTQTDNSIAQFDSAIQNIDPDIFGSDSSLFQPGARIRVHIFMGDSTAFPIGTVWLDESGYGQLESTVKVSGRNTIGYYLKDQTFDDTTVFEGTVSEVLEAILYHAGLTNYKVQPMDETNKFEFKPSDTLLSGIETILDFYTTIENKMEIVELTDGTICIGYDYWISTHLPRNYYSFDEGREVFKRNITRAADGSYSRIRVTGKDSDGNELQAVTVEVENFKYWSLGRHRTKHLSAPDGLTQEGLQAWAEGQASILQYIGVAEDFVGPFRPQLVVGDIAEVVHGSTGTSLGIITQVKQVFDRQNGFVTEFSVDSGGIVTEAAATFGLNDATVRDGPVYSRSARVNGYNRKQSIVDLVKYTAEKANKVDSLTANDVGAEKKGTSSDLLSRHNENIYAHPDIRALLIAKLPSPLNAAKGQYLRIKSVDENGNVTEVEATSVDISDGEIDAATLGGKTLNEVVEMASDAYTLEGRTLEEIVEMTSDADTLGGKTLEEVVELASNSDAATLGGKTLNEVIELASNSDADTLGGKTLDEVVDMASDASTLEVVEHNKDSSAHSDIREAVAQKLPIPSRATEHQYLRVLSVDEHGTVTGVEAVDMDIDVGIDEDALNTVMDEHNRASDAHQYIQNRIDQKIPMPETAKSGQYLRIADVDSNGKVVATEAADSPSFTATAVVENGVLIVVTDPPSSTATAVVENGVLIVK